MLMLSRRIMKGGEAAPQAETLRVSESLFVSLTPMHTPVVGSQCMPGSILRSRSVTVQRGNAEMYRQSGQVISREQGLRYDAGFAVPVLMS